jgi:hypothetical protein
LAACSTTIDSRPEAEPSVHLPRAPRSKRTRTGLGAYWARLTCVSRVRITPRPPKSPRSSFALRGPAPRKPRPPTQIDFPRSTGLHKARSHVEVAPTAFCVGAAWFERVSRPGRVGGDTEPPNSATETNTGRGVFLARNPQSPVRVQKSGTAKTPRNREDFSRCAGVRAESLCGSGLNGGGGSPERTRLYCRFPDLQGKYREILRNWTLLADPAPRFRSLSQVIATDSL